MYKCKICGKKYTDLSGLYNHIESKHADMIPKDMSVQQYYYYTKTGKLNGNCVMCKQPTTWNKNTNKYNRFCNNPKCKEKYAKIMKDRMIAKYGKVHLLNDPEKQREMLSKRKISGTYEWSDGKSETTYTGSYELDFLKTMDLFFEWDPEDILMPSPHTYTYRYEGEDKFYIPDVFIPSLDLEIEIKDGGDNPNNHYKIQAVDKEKEKLKDEVLKSQKNFHYVKITNKNYTNFFDFLKEIKDGFEKYGDDKKIPRIFKIEDIKTGSTKPVQETYESIEEGFIENIINDRKITPKRKIRDNDFFISLNYNVKKDSPKELQALISKLIKGARCEDDMKYIKELVGKSQTYYHNLLKKKPELEDEYQLYYDWINDGMREEIKDRMKKIKESTEILEEKFEPDKFLVWFDKPIQKVLGRKIKLYHGSTELVDGDIMEPISFNVGATKYSDPRWSTYFWDNKEDAMKWVTAIVVNNVYKYSIYIGHNGKTLIGKPENMTDKEVMKEIVRLASGHKFYVYEVEIDIDDLEIGSCPSIKEYTVSKPVNIVKRYNYELNPEILRRFFTVTTEEEINKWREQGKTVKNLKLHRNVILNNILDNTRDSYRGIMRTDLRQGNIKVGDDLSQYKDSINYHVKRDSYRLKESTEDIIYESSISLARINQCLQNEYEAELRKYLNDYRSYYQEILKEKPHAIPHINEDIKKAIIFIDGLANKGVENNLVQIAKSELGDIANLSKHSKPMKVNDHIVLTLNESTHVKGNIWVGTDWHFYRNKNNTNFKTNPHIDEIIKNHNKYVGKNDTFIFLGDLYDARTIFDMNLVPKIFKIKDLKGYKIMIKGNHDVNTDEFYLNLGFDEVYEKEYRIGNIVFTHEPAKVKNDEINIHGHIHFSNTYWDVDPLNHIDACTEHYDFKPVTIKQLIDEYKGTDRLSREAISRFNRTESVFESTNDITLKLKYENNKARRLFSLTDIKSEMIINNEYVVKRDKVGNHCSVSQILENVDYPNSIEFNIHFNEEINCKEHISSNIFEGVCINTLYDFNDKEYKFIREACLRLFGRYPDSIEIK